jgi:hypothetical protein
MTCWAEAWMQKPSFQKMLAANGDASAYQSATIYAQWGNRV